MFKRLLVFFVSMVSTVYLELLSWTDWNVLFTLSSAVMFYILGLYVYLQAVRAFKPDKDKLLFFAKLTLTFALYYGAFAICCYIISTLVSLVSPLSFWVVTRFGATLVIVFVNFDIVFERKNPNYIEYVIATIDKKPILGKKAPITTPQGTLMLDTTGLTEEEFLALYNDVKNSYEA